MEDNSRPKRLEEETARYLQQIDLQWDATAAQAEQADRDIIIQNVLDEIKQRTASAACDRRTNAIIEKLCYFAPLTSLLEVMERLSPYTVFLSRNRHSSHILQAILARLCYILKFEGIGEIEQDRLSSVILALIQPLLDEISWLAKEISASHVIRSALCLLAGMPVIAERKGKSSKHQHSISLSEPLDVVLLKGNFYVDSAVCFPVPGSP